MTGRGSFDILACQTCDSSDNTGDPRVTDCHLFLAISLSLFDFGHYDPAQVLSTLPFDASFSYFKFKYGKSQGVP